MSLLEVNGLCVDYEGSSGPVVDDLSFRVEAGETLGLVGESGSGKSQTALCLMGLLPVGVRTAGRILFDGSELLGADERTLNRVRARQIAMVFQDPAQALNPYLRIGDQLRRVLIRHAIVPRREVRARALDLLRRVGLPDVERQYRSFPHQLSGGMRQRAMIATALAGEPRLLIADEPTTALDVTVQAQILELLRDLKHDTGIALLLITHDLGVIAGNCDRMLVMQHGRMLECGNTGDIFAHPAHPHTRDMLAAAPRIDMPPAAGGMSNDAASTVLDVDRLSVSYVDGQRLPGWGLVRGARSLRAVHSVSVAVRAGETLAIVGESGSGKTTLARAILGLLPPDEGSMHFLGDPLPPRAQSRARSQRRRLQLVFQDPVASLNPAMRVGEILSEPVRLHDPSPDRARRAERVAAMLVRVGLDGSFSSRFPHELSGGQAQRVAIARALMPEPRLLVCDEAVASLDGTVRREILDLLRDEQARSGLALIFITHDLAVVRQISHRILVMYMGGVCELAGNEDLFSRPRHPYTRALMDAVPVPDPSVGPGPAPITGETASLLDLPPGCPFHPRCAHAVARCRQEVPPPTAIGAGRVACHRAAELDLRATPCA